MTLVQNLFLNKILAYGLEVQNCNYINMYNYILAC